MERPPRPRRAFLTTQLLGLALLALVSGRLVAPCAASAGELQQLRDDVRDNRSKRDDDSSNQHDEGNRSHGVHGCGGYGDHGNPYWDDDPAGFFMTELLALFFFPDALDRWRPFPQDRFREDCDLLASQCPRADLPADEAPPDGSRILRGWPRHVFNVTCGVAASPFWVPRWAIGDSGVAECDFSGYPYQNGRGYLLINGCVDVPRLVAFRLRSDYAEDFDNLSRIGGHLLVSTVSRWGLDAEMNQLQERLPNDARDRLWLGDCNIVYHFAQSERSQWRAGLGFNWLDDPIDTNYGFNFTYGFDLFPVKPFVLSTELDWGTLGQAEAFHFRTTAGAMINRFETYVGYEYRDIDSFQFSGLVAGVRLWF